MPKPSIVMATEPAPITPPSAPMMHNEPDDIPEPAVPAAVLDPSSPPGTPPPAVPPTVPALPDALLPLAQGFCQYLQARMHDWMMDEHRQLTKGMDVTLSGIRDYATKVLQCNEHAEYQMADAMHKLRDDGLKLVETPYTMQVQVLTPAGIPLTLTVRKQSAAELLDELTRLEAWLSQHGYTAQEGVAA